MARKILVVGDKQHNTARLVEINLQRAGYEVVTAYDGVEALAKVASEKPEMIILCSSIESREAAHELLAKLQGDPATKEIPVIAISLFPPSMIMGGEKEDEEITRDIHRWWSEGVSGDLAGHGFNPRELLLFVRRIFQFESEYMGLFGDDNPDTRSANIGR
jgi:two-component system, OmpR family, alkaline phosphatase synthesis response regulator PhoP